MCDVFVYLVSRAPDYIEAKVHAVQCVLLLCICMYYVVRPRAVFFIENHGCLSLPCVVCHVYTCMCTCVKEYICDHACINHPYAAKVKSSV